MSPLRMRPSKPADSELTDEESNIKTESESESRSHSKSPDLDKQSTN